MKKWNCEIIPLEQLSYPVAKFCEKIECVVVRVPVRMRGLTSSGKLGGCYYNVKLAMGVFGGTGLVGWVIKNVQATKPPHLIATLIGHAVWLNKQGRASCVTAKSWSSDAVQTINGKHFIDMIICGEQKEGNPLFVHDLHIVHDKVRRKYLFLWKVGEQKRSIRQDELDRSTAARLFVDHEYMAYERDFQQKVIRANEPDVATKRILEGFEKVGGFSEVSVTTGRTFAEIKEDRLSRARKR